MSEIQHPPQVTLSLVPGHDVALDGRATGNEKLDDFRIALQNAIDLSRKRLEQVAVPDDSVLQGFVKSTRILARWKSSKCRRVGKDQTRLVECPDEVFHDA